MDTSETYIKMCDCKEIQGEWKVLKGDFYFSSGDTSEKKLKATREVRVLTITNHIDYQNEITQGGFPCTEHGTGKKGEYIWLPRQDQIQDMPAWEGFPMAYFLRKLYMRFHPEFDIKSWEQLWLAFYMYEKHDKKWDGKQWMK